MTSSSPMLRSIITGIFVLFILALAMVVSFPVPSPVPAPVTSPASASPHAFIVTMAELPPIEAFHNVTLSKLMSPTRAQEKAGTYPMTEDLSFVNITPGFRTQPHILLGTPEVMYVLSGSATVYANGSRVEATSGELVFIPGDTVQSTVNNGNVPLWYISLLDPYYAESREIRLNASATTDISRDTVPLRVWNQNETTPLVSFDRLNLYQMISPTATNNDGLNMTVPYSWAYVTAPATGGSLPHTLNATSEVIYVISGLATAHIGNETFALHEGDTFYIPPDTVQSVTNTGSSTLEYLSLLDPYWRPET
jgi:mannose-6-phosphate isomerase-like protein (cupin superfamily)